jgi:hypothetical protein
MQNPLRPEPGTPLWIVLVLLAVFGAAMFVSGYLTCAYLAG